MRRFLGTVLLCLTLAPIASATPITIVQTFGPATAQMVVNGTLQSVSGDWVFKVVTDTSTPDLNPFPTSGRFAAAVTVSNSGLGLIDVGVVSHPFYYENTFESGIASATGGSATILAPTNANAVLGSPNLIQPALLTFTAQNPLFTLSVTNLLVLANGTTIRFNGRMASGAQSVEALPEPTSMLLLGTGLIGAGMRRYRQRRSRA